MAAFDSFNKNVDLKNRIRRFLSSQLEHEYAMLLLYKPQELLSTGSKMAESELSSSEKEWKVTIDPSRVNEPGYL